jgi:hypothetical protein
LKCTYLLASVALASVTSAQVSVDWITTHDVAPSANNEFGAIAVDATGRMAVGGHSHTEIPFSGGLSFGDFETCLYKPDGTLTWSRSMHVSYKDVCNAVAFDDRGGVFVAGTATDKDFGQTHYRVLLHYDAVGNLLWSNARIGTSGTTYQGNALALCANGDVIVAGALSGDLSLERFDAAGNIVWSWIADGGHGWSDYLSAVAVGPGGDVWATGRVGAVPPFSSTGSEIVAVRVNSAGNPVWIRTVENTNQSTDYGSALVVDAAGYASVAGQLAGDAAVARWGPAGHLAWVRKYDGGLGGDAKRIELDPFGRIVAAGQLWNGPLWNNVPHPEFAVWCFDTAGNLNWQGTFDPGGWWNEFGDLVIDAMGAVWLCGSIPNYYLAIASWDSTGAFRWSWRSPADMRSHARAAAVSGNDVIVAGGFTAGPGSPHWDGLVMKLSRTAVEYCFGDGSSTPCPCANASAAEQHAGCANSLGLGARLVDKGTSSLAADTLVLEGSQMSSGDALYFQGTSSMSGGAGELFGDGLRCVGGTVIRLGSSTNVAGASQFPDVGDPSVSVRGLVTTPGSRRTYQTWYRDTSVFCTPANFNFSNGLLITWTL